jgi:hypothetical protein
LFTDRHTRAEHYAEQAARILGQWVLAFYKLLNVGVRQVKQADRLLRTVLAHVSVVLGGVVNFRQVKKARVSEEHLA